MTPWERKTYEDMHAIGAFLKEHGMRPSELLRLAKKMCCCGTCAYFEPHYTRDGQGLDWGHCFHGTKQHSKRVSEACCSMWEDSMEGMEVAE